MGDYTSSQGGSNNENKKNEQDKSGEDQHEAGDAPVFVTPLGFKEVDYVRTAKKGNYTPTINEIDDLILSGKISWLEIRLLLLIKRETINWKRTEIRLKRKTIAERLNIAQPNLAKALKLLVESNYIIEKADKDNYYYYSLNPITFCGLIVLRSEKESLYRLNPQMKKAMGIKKVDESYSKKLLELEQKAIAIIAKSYSETDSSIENYKGISMLKYILLKYILLNRLSASSGEHIVRLLEGTLYPERSIQTFAKMIKDHPASTRGIMEELFRAEREGTHANTRSKLQDHPVMYLFKQWDAVKHHWQGMDHKIDMDERSVQLRAELYQIMAEWPLPKSNVIQFKKKDAV